MQVACVGRILQMDSLSASTSYGSWEIKNQRHSATRTGLFLPEPSRFKLPTATHVFAPLHTPDAHIALFDRDLCAPLEI